jgi:2-phospho-L-lactate guanylyltransferase (CobY/MobA/RfbA family)
MADYATRLTITLSTDKRKEYQKGTLEDWIMDSHKIARKVVYVDGKNEITRKKDEVQKLSADYVLNNAEVVEVQLTKGGVRLAQFLNDTFKD